MNHGIPQDARGVAVGYFTYCGRHVSMFKNEDHLAQPDKVTCPKCIRLMPAERAA